MFYSFDSRARAARTFVRSNKNKHIFFASQNFCFDDFGRNNLFIKFTRCNHQTTSNEDYTLFCLSKLTQLIDITIAEIMSNHHGHHRSSHHSRSRAHHSSSHYQSIQSRSRNSSSNINNSSNSGTSRGQQAQESRDSVSDWSEHRSSSGKVYYYNTRTGVSQWEIPAELRQQRPASPESEISESSSIRQQQDNSPSSSASSHNSAQSECVPEDKPLLTPSLAQYFKPELIVNFTSSQTEELERQANQQAREALMLNERILKASVELKIAKAVVHYVEISLEAQEKKYSILRDTINNFGFA